MTPLLLPSVLTTKYFSNLTSVRVANTYDIAMSHEMTQ